MLRLRTQNLGKKIPGTWPGELNREVSRLGDARALGGEPDRRLSADEGVI